MAAEENRNSDSPPEDTHSAARASTQKSADDESSLVENSGATASESPGSPLDTPELQPVVRELVRLAKEQGYLTFDDINEALPEARTDIELLEELITRLRAMKFRIVDSAEADNVKSSTDEGDVSSSEGDDGGSEDGEGEKASGEREGRLDILDDPVRMYLKQMGQVPLLTREQEVEISKRIEKPREIAQALQPSSVSPGGLPRDGRAPRVGEERFDRIINDKHVDSRERYLKKRCPPAAEVHPARHHRGREEVRQTPATRSDDQGRAHTEDQIVQQARKKLADHYDKLLFQTEGVEDS